jgi:hypothetical protein
MLKFNINHYIYVKFTDAGYQKLADNFNEYLPITGELGC